MGIYGLQKKKFVKRADGSKMYLPNEIAEMIIRLILLEVPINKEYLDNCPTRKGGKDMNNICTSYRCSDATCPYCKAKLGWNKNNYELCNVTSCNKIRTAFQKILKLVFNYQGPETRVKSLWPPTTEIGLRFVNTMLVGCCQDLTEKQLLLYNVLLKSLKIYRRGVNG